MSKDLKIFFSFNNHDDNNTINGNNTMEGSGTGSTGIPATYAHSSLKGKVAVITGSTQGLGEATARLFHQRGIDGLIITGRNAERGNAVAASLSTSSSSSSSCKAIFVQASLEDLDQCRRIIQAADEHFGRVDILVNAAAWTGRGSIWDTTPEMFDKMMQINTRAPFFLMQEAIRIMERENIAGSIINISSTASYGSMPMLAPYSISKGALNVATKNIAYAVMRSRIRVNALAIGWMNTPGEDTVQREFHSMPDEGRGEQETTPTAAAAANDEGTWLEAAVKQQPFGRLLEPMEVARCIAYCASDESGMMTGCIIDFDQSVWGGGPAPVPPTKDQWAKSKGMTYSFQEKE